VIRVPKVALLVETSGHYGRSLLRGVIRHLRLHGPWSLYVDPGHFEQGLPKGEFTGIIARICSLKLARDIKDAGLPAVVLEAGIGELAITSPLEGFNQILTDSPAIAKMVADHFVGQGLRSFAFCGFENCPWSLRREEAFYRYVTDKGFPCFRHRINLHNWMRHADWVRAWHHEQPRLAMWLKSLPRLIGVMACNDMCGRQVLEACAQAGVRVPAHLAVVGVDNDELICELSCPPLSSVALDVERAGYEAARLLAGLMADHSEKRRHVIPNSPLWVVGRRSSDLVFKDDPLVIGVLHFIKDHAGDGIVVPDVVNQMGVSRRTLERRFFHATGRSVLAEIACARLDRAKCLLQETALPVYHVASEAGFANVRMLNRIFRRVEGCPPASFRRHLIESTAAYGQVKQAG
jgi:LacI family transcriptional regulator